MPTVRASVKESKVSAAPEQRDRIIDREMKLRAHVERARRHTPAFASPSAGVTNRGALARTTSRRPPSRDRRSSRSCTCGEQ
jgi:hypothetical protein